MSRHDQDALSSGAVGIVADASISTCGRDRNIASKIYSPSETQDWLRCPKYRQLRRVNLEANTHGWDMKRDVGLALHTGMAAYYRGLQQGASDPFVGAQEAMAQDLAKRYVVNDRYPFDGIFKNLLKALRAVVEGPLQCPPERVLAVEERISHCIFDVVTRVNDELILTDHKTHYELALDRAGKRLAEFKVSHQLCHQAWAWREYHGETPRWVRIQQVIVTPRVKVSLEPFPMNDRIIDQWLQSSEVHWSRMQSESESDFAPMNFEACTSGKYGECEFLAHCHQGASLETMYRERERND